MIVGTAGHIDHGKTSLVRALSGVDTDRLPEEKARGISIDLGYAYASLGNGDVLGFVDVPGHEKFVPTMLAGATGIDFALLAVAADDGVMAQTREHLNILALLGITEGAIALTKIDRVDADRADAVERDMSQLTAHTPLAGAPIFRLSSRTGVGVDALRDHLQRKSEDRGLLVRAAANAGVRNGDGHFRLAVDRAFVLRGIGTIVTGTVHSGEVRVGARVVVAPNGGETRVRSIHAQDRAADVGRTGERCALNLAGLAKDDVRRGDWIVDPPIALATQRLDAQLFLLAAEPHALSSGSTVHLHLGAAHVPARVVVLGADASDAHTSDDIAPGTRALVQIIAQANIAAWRGDRFIVRDTTASRTIGGGRVLDPFAPARYRRSRDRLNVLAALGKATPVAQLEALIADSAFGIDLRHFVLSGNVQDIGSLVQPLTIRRIAGDGFDFAVSEGRWHVLKDRVVEALAEFHEGHPDELGPDTARLRRIACPKLDEVIYRALIGDLLRTGSVRQNGPWLHLPGHDNAPSPQERALVDRVLPHLLDAPFDPPWVRDLARIIAQPEALLRTAMIRASKRGELFQVVHDLFFHPAAIHDLAAIAEALQRTNGEVRAAAFRDATHLGRKRAINVLEFFDRVGFTRRLRDKHIVRADSLLALDKVAIALGDGQQPHAAHESI
jgi:selenocysteine-specific elongation factor